MNSKLISALYAFVIALILANCVQETDFSKINSDRDTVIVDGVFSDGPGPHFLRLTHPGGVNKQVFESIRNAQVVLSDDAGNQFPYQETASADGKSWFYQLDDVRGMPGRTYSVEIRLSDGREFRSRPEKMLEHVPVDSVQVKGEWFVSTDADGSITREPFAYLYAYARSPAQVSGRYLRWDAESVHIFNEVVKIYNPFAAQHQCFITNRLNDQKVTLADLSQYQAGAPIFENVGKKRINNDLEQRICFLVYQHTISRTAFEYWQKIAQLIAPTGTIFDAPSSKVYGNVENLSDPDNPALGYFEVSTADTARVYTSNGQLGDEFVLPTNNYCDYDWSNWPPVNHPECDNCLLLPSSTLEKPSWWQ